LFWTAVVYVFVWGWPAGLLSAWRSSLNCHCGCDISAVVSTFSRDSVISLREHFCDGLGNKSM
jgi:hypothetical protein